MIPSLQALVALTRAALGAIVPPPSSPGRRDRGVVSLEQVLWFVAAGVSVAVIAAILWSQIRAQASTPVDVPAAP